MKLKQSLHLLNTFTKYIQHTHIRKKDDPCTVLHCDKEGGAKGHLIVCDDERSKMSRAPGSMADAGRMPLGDAAADATVAVSVVTVVYDVFLL